MDLTNSVSVWDSRILHDVQFKIHYILCNQFVVIVQASVYECYISRISIADVSCSLSMDKLKSMCKSQQFNLNESIKMPSSSSFITAYDQILKFEEEVDFYILTDKSRIIELNYIAV